MAPTRTAMFWSRPGAGLLARRLRLGLDDDAQAAGVLVVAPATLLHPGVPQPDGTVLYEHARRMTPEEQGEAHALLVKAASDPDWHAACEALDALLGKLLVVQRLLEVDGRLAKGAPPADPG